MLRADPSRNLVAVHLGQADVEQHHVRVRRAHPLERIAAAVRRLRVVAADPEQRGERIGRVLVVVDDEHAPRIGTLGSAGGAARHGAPARSIAASRIWNVDAAPRCRRSRADTWPPCISTRRADHREADAEPALRAVGRAVALHEQVEDARQQLRRRCRCRCRVTSSTTFGPPACTAPRRSRRPSCVYFAAFVQHVRRSICTRRAQVAVHVRAAPCCAR